MTVSASLCCVCVEDADQLPGVSLHLFTWWLLFCPHLFFSSLCHFRVLYPSRYLHFLEASLTPLTHPLLFKSQAIWTMSVILSPDI